MRRLKASSLVEAIVAALVFLIVFAAAMNVLPRLTVRDDDAVLLVEADYRACRAMEKYGTGLWPCGIYTEEYDWGGAEIRITPYRDFADMRQVEVSVRADGTQRRIFRRQLITAAP